MIQPTQDTDVTSSISPLSHLSNDYIAGDDVMLMRGKSISTAMATLYLDKPIHDSKRSMKHQGFELVNSLSETSPWVLKFSKYITSAVGSKNVKMLMQLQIFYIENMSKDVNTCYTKPYRAAKLKTHINEILIFFHLYWQNIKDRDNDRDQYLNKMTEILGMYFDMELKASRRGKDLPSKIAAKLFTAMVIYLDNSEKHIFQVLFRVKFMTKNYSEICSPIFRKLFDRFSGNDRCIADVSYTRYLLALKLWKKIKDDLRDKKEINELAVKILGQKSPIFSSELVKIIPKVPDFYKNGSLWLLQGNSFDLRKACDNFVKYELREDTIPLPENVGETEIINGINIFSTQIDETQSERICPSPMKDRSKETKVSGKKLVKKVVKLRKFKPKLPNFGPGEVVFIDLTAENEENKQTTVKKKKKKKKEEKRKLGWLKELQKNAKHSKQVQDNQPISENKISESTERTGIHCLEKAEHYSAKEAWRVRTACESCYSCPSRHGNMLDRNKLYIESHVSSQSSPSKVVSTINDRSLPQREHVTETDVANRDAVFSYGKRDSLESVVTSDYKNEGESSVVAIDGERITCDTFQNAVNQSLLSSVVNIEIVETSQKSQGCISSVYCEVGGESCVVSTTKSSNKQQTMMPESTNKIFVGELLPELESPQRISDEISARQLRRTVETAKHRDEGESIDVNDALQRNLIQALSLDSVIDIPTNDNTSRSDKTTEESKSKRENRTYGNVMLDNDDDSFLDIPEMKLRDEIETGVGLSGNKEIVDEFENIDILDSILNGDMSMEDILDEPQQATVNEPSSNVFNFFNKFFKHGEITSKKADSSLGMDEMATTKSLPEGSLGITGLLNSLLDSDLTSFDVPPSDFMYSNVQTVAPRLIRRSPTSELKSDFATTSNVIVSNEQSSTKDQLFLDKKDEEIVDDQLEDFTLDETKPTVFEMPVLEEELIHLPQHSLIVDTIIPSSSCESPLSTHSDSNVTLIDVEAGPSSTSHDYDNLFTRNFCNALKSKKYENLKTFRQSNDSSNMLDQSEKLDDLTELNGSKELSDRNGSNSSKHFDHPATLSDNLNEVARHSSTEMDTVENLPTSLLTDFTPPQSVDSPQSPCPLSLSPVGSNVQANPHSPTNSIDKTRSSAMANLLTPPPSITSSSCRTNITPPLTPLHFQEESSNRQLRGIATNRRRRCPPARPQHHSDVSELVTTSTDVEPQAQPTVGRVKRNCSTTNNNIKYEIDEVEEVEESSSNFIDRLSDVQLVLKTFESHEIRTTGGPISLLKSSKQNVAAQLTKESQPTSNYRTHSMEVSQQMNLKKLGLTTQANKQVLVNLNGKTKPAVVFDRNGKNMLLKMLHEESRSCSNIVYKLTSANNKPYTKLPKVNFSLKSKVESRRQSTTTKRRDSIEDIDEESQRPTMVPARYSARRSKSQLSKTAKEQNVRKNLSGTNIDEEPSSKKRKMDCKLLPMVENEGLMFALASRKTQEKRSNIIRRDYGCKDRAKKTIV